MGKPTTIPNKITHPKEAPKISATATGPGVGGTKAWVMASPAKRGRAYSKSDFPVLRCKEYTKGTNTIKATSKKTGIAIKNPAISMAQEARCSPMRSSNACAIAVAPPECSNIPPKRVPKPTTMATKPRVLPIPVCRVFIMVSTPRPETIPTTILEIKRATNAGNLNRKINSSSTEIPKSTANNKGVSIPMSFWQDSISKMIFGF